MLLLVTSALTCSEQPAQPAADSVELVRAVSLDIPAIVIGQDAVPGDDFLFPLIAGHDGSGSVYVYDARLNELRRFAPAGGFERVVAGRGRGPGELDAPSIGPLPWRVLAEAPYSGAAIEETDTSP